MIGPVSGTGRAMMASLQQAMAKGMPADQAVQYVKSMATQGVAPLADLYAMMNQFQRLKQPQAQPPQTPPTIRDQLNMIDQQQQMQGGIGGMQAPAPQPSPMDRGLGAIDAGRMEYPQFAGGGVVALAGGGVGDSSTDLESELNQLEEALAADDYVKSGLGGSLGRVVQTSTMPLGYAQRQKMEARLNQLRNAKSYEAKSGPSTRGRYRPEGASTTPAVTPSQSPVPPAASPMSFDEAIAMARAGVRQDTPPAMAPPAALPPAASPFAPSSGAGRAGASQASPRAMARPDFMSGLDEYRGSQGEYVGKQLREQEALDKQYGLGKESEAYKARLKQVDEMTKDRSKRESEDRRMDRAEFFFNIAAQATQPGATFVGSIAKAGPGFAKASRETTNRLRDLQERAQEAQLRLMEAEQLRKEGNVKGAQQSFAAGKKQMIETGMELYKIQKQEEQNIRTTNAMIRQSDPGGLTAMRGELSRKIVDDPNLSNEQKLALITGKSDRRLLTTALNSVDNRIKTLQNNLAKTFIPADKAAIQADLQEALDERQLLIASNPELAEIMSGSMGVTGGAGAGGGSSGSMGRLRFNPETGLIE